MENSWMNSFSNKNLELIVFVTEQCNFRCIYCYEDFKIGKIESKVVEGIKNLISKRIKSIDNLILSYFGGEPLLNKSIIFEISNWAKEECLHNNVKYFASITTNGYLLDEQTFEKLIQAEVRNFQITLDGEKKAHDAFRPMASGKSTFDKIYSNIVMMAESSHNFSCTIRLNIADYNFNSIKIFINEYIKPPIDNNRFKFHFHPIFGIDQLRLTKEEQLGQLTELTDAKGFTHSSPSDNGTCYAAKADSFVIRADGRVQKCTVALENEMNNVGIITEDGTLNLDQEKLKKWIFAEDKSCPVQSFTFEKIIKPYEGAGKYLNYQLPINI